jgi:hypothetical protein
MFVDATMRQREGGFKHDAFNTRLAGITEPKEKIKFLQETENPYLNKVKTFFFLF